MGSGSFLNGGLIVGSMEYKDGVHMPCEVVKLTPQVGQRKIDFKGHDFGLSYASSTKVSYSIMLFLVCSISPM